MTGFYCVSNIIKYCSPSESLSEYIVHSLQKLRPFIIIYEEDQRFRLEVCKLLVLFVQL